MAKFASIKVEEINAKELVEQLIIDEVNTKKQISTSQRVKRQDTRARI